MASVEGFATPEIEAAWDAGDSDPGKEIHEGQADGIPAEVFTAGARKKLRRARRLSPFGRVRHDVLPAAKNLGRDLEIVLRFRIEFARCFILSTLNPMAVTHTNRRGKTYYLHTGPKRGGGIQHYFATKATGQLAESLPAGFEVYETVNGNVYLRRRQPALIREEELESIRSRVNELRTGCRYQVEARGNAIIVHESSTDLGFLSEINPLISREKLDQLSAQFAQYIPVVRLVLVDTDRRLFAPECYCFRGSVEDWISIGPPESVAKLAAKYVKHLGQDSFYELF